jgi:hypothetical protein
MKHATSSDDVLIPTHLIPLPAPTSASPDSDLPGWESFPQLDRHLLVTLIVQTARRQLLHGTTAPACSERR